MRCITLVAIAGLAAVLSGCGEAPEGSELRASAAFDASRSPSMEEVRRNPLPAVGKASSALVATGCRQNQREAAVQGQELLLRALIDATNAYAADPGSELAMDLFGARNEDQTLTVYYNLLWAVQTLRGDGGNYNIEYSCNSSWECGESDIAYSATPYFTTVCKPDADEFWFQVPYVMAHEMFHWLGWTDPHGGVCDGDCPEDVHMYARDKVETAIAMPHSYALYITEFIKPLYTEQIYYP